MAVLYLEKLLSGDPIKANKGFVSEAKTLLKMHTGKYDALICTGVSGMATAMILSIKTKLPIVYVRKRGESSHSCYKIEIPNSLCKRKNNKPWRVIFVDDTIDSGKTLKRVKIAMGNENMELAGILLWFDRTLYTPEAKALVSTEIDHGIFHNLLL